MYNYEGNLGDKNERINPLFTRGDKHMYLSVLILIVFWTYDTSFAGIAERRYLANGLILCSLLVKIFASVIPFTSKGSLL